MALVRFTPRIPSLWRDFDELFRDFTPPQVWEEETAKAFAPPADIADTGKALEVHLDMPGFTPEQIEVKVEQNVLTVSAERTEEKSEQDKGWLRRERSWGRFARSFTLPTSVDGDKPEASYKHGVLTVVLPKKQEVLPKSVKVKVEA